MIGHNSDRVANGASALGFYPALVSAQPPIDINTGRKWDYPRLIEPVVAADSTRDELHLNVVRA
jgi:hypothetical protein